MANSAYFHIVGVSTTPFPRSSEQAGAGDPLWRPRGESRARVAHTLHVFTTSTLLARIELHVSQSSQTVPDFKFLKNKNTQRASRLEKVKKAEGRNRMFWEVSGCGVKVVRSTSVERSYLRIWEPSCGRFRPPAVQRRNFTLHTLDHKKITAADFVRVKPRRPVTVECINTLEGSTLLPPCTLHLYTRKPFGGFLYLHPPPAWAPPTLYTLRFRVCPSLSSPSKPSASEAFALGHDKLSAFPSVHRDPLIFGAVTIPTLRPLFQQDNMLDTAMLERCTGLSAKLRSQIHPSESEHGDLKTLNPLRTLVFAYRQPFWIDFANTGQRKQLIILGNEDGEDVVTKYSMFFYREPASRPHWKRAGFEDTFTGIIQAHLEKMRLPDGSVSAVVRVLKIHKPIQFIPPVHSTKHRPPEVAESIISWPSRVKEGALLPYRDQNGSWGQLIETSEGEKVLSPLRLLKDIPDDVDPDSW